MKLVGEGIQTLSLTLHALVSISSVDTPSKAVKKLNRDDLV
jgi:hypothetical protein